MKYVYEYCLGDYDQDLSEKSIFYAGTEYEIEDVKKVMSTGEEDDFPPLTHEPISYAGYNWMLDGSLRNNGLEVTTPPLTFQESLNAFSEIHDNVVTGPLAYSERTSIHVHVNVLPWTEKKLYDFVLLYALLEPAFFSKTPKRQHNINCVPLNYTMLPAKYNLGIEHLISIWSKYTAFNLLPIKKYGTVEFRHMYGTGDYYIYKEWLAMIRNLWEFTNKEKEGTLKKLLLKRVSPGELAATILGNSFQDLDYSKSLIDVKLAFI